MALLETAESSQLDQVRAEARAWFEASWDPVLLAEQLGYFDRAARVPAADRR